MEILQTIWNALTTENMELTNVLMFLPMCLEAFLTMSLFTTILNIHVPKKVTIIYVLVLSITSELTIFFISTPFNTFINIFISFTLIKLLLRATFLQSFTCLIIQYLSIVLLGIIINSSLLIVGINTLTISTIPLFKIISSLFIYLILFVLYMVIKHIKFNISLNNITSRKSNFILYSNLIIGIIAIAIQSYLATLYNKDIPVFISIFSIFIVFIYFCISIYSLSRTTKLEETSRDLEGEKLVNKSLTILHDNIRAFKHDFNNIVQAIGGYITTNDMPGLKNYYSQLLDDCQRVNNLTTLSPEVINNPAIYSLLASKYHKADELGIKINLEIFLDLNTLNIKIYELTRIMGILLDNAIEATLECDEKVIHVIMRKDTAHHRQLLIIENTYLNKDINLDKIFEKSYSTKPNNTGLGLWEVRQILKKNTNLNLFTTKDDKFFRQQLEIY